MAELVHREQIREREPSTNKNKVRRTGQPIKIEKERYGQNEVAIKPMVDELIMSVNKIDMRNKDKRTPVNRNRPCEVEEIKKVLRNSRNKSDALNRSFHLIDNSSKVHLLQNSKFYTCRENIHCEHKLPLKNCKQVQNREKQSQMQSRIKKESEEGEEEHGRERKIAGQKLEKSSFNIIEIQSERENQKESEENSS